MFSRRTVLLVFSPAQTRPATPPCAPTRTACSVSGFWTRQLAVLELFGFGEKCPTPSAIISPRTSISIRKTSPSCVVLGFMCLASALCSRKRWLPLPHASVSNSASDSRRRAVSFPSSSLARVPRFQVWFNPLSSAVDPRFITGTRSVLFSRLLTSGPTPFCLSLGCNLSVRFKGDLKGV